MTASTLALADFRTRISQVLMDTSNQTWSTNAVDESLRQALEDMSRVVGTKLVVKDLDSAAATTVDNRDEEVLVRGAAGYAARSKALDRSQSMNLGQQMTSDLLDWAKNTLYYYEDKLKQIRNRTIAASANNKPGAWTWDESNKNW